MGVVTFNYAAWSLLFPELVTGGVTNTLATALFGIVTTPGAALVDNSDCSIVHNLAGRATLIDYAIAHMASLSGYSATTGTSGPQPTGAVGRVASATQGSVSASMDYGTVRESQAFWLQSQYGAIFWQLSRTYRTMMTRPKPNPYMGPAYGLRQRW